MKKKINEFEVSFVSNALVLPYSGFGGEQRTFEGGVYDQDGQFITRSKQIKAGFENIVVDPPASKVFNPGVHIYGGLLVNNHFGHFLIESLSRLWCCNYLKSYSSVVFSVRNKQASIPSYIVRFLDMIGIKDVKVVEEPENFELLLVPEQLAHPDRGYILGYKPNKNLFKGIIAPREGYPEKIYISRSKLSKDEGGFFCEDVLEKNLQKDGYKIIHPQDLDLEEQIALYVSAKKIVFSDGSAFHLYALFSRPDQKVFVVWRRGKMASFYFQLTSFSGNAPVGDSFVLGHYEPRGWSLPKSKIRSKICFDGLRKQMFNEGFLQSADWMLPGYSDVSSEIKVVEKILNCELVYHLEGGDL